MEDTQRSVASPSTSDPASRDGTPTGKGARVQESRQLGQEKGLVVKSVVTPVNGIKEGIKSFEGEGQE